MAGSTEMLAAFRELTTAKQLERSDLLDLLRDGIQAALVRKFGPNVKFELSVDEMQGTIKVVRLRQVIETVEDPSWQISLEEARYEDPEFQPGDIMEIPVDFAEFGRTAGSRLDCFVVGLNDLRKETGVLPQPGRTYLVPWLMQVILAVRAYGLDAIDSVFNDFRDADGFEAECAHARAMGFDGKMLIHPAQIESANRHFGPDDAAIREAEEIIAAFADPATEGLNVINSNGRMIERLHLVQAESLVHKSRLIAERKS